MISDWLGQNKWVAAAVLALVSFFAAWITELLSSVPGAGLSIWLPTGFLFALAAVTPRGCWPYWALGAAAAEIAGNLIWYHHAPGPAALLIGGNIAAALTGALLFAGAGKARFKLARLGRATRFLLIVAVAMPLISATLGSFALGWSYDRPSFSAWPRILLGDASGNVIAAPLALLLLGAAAPLPGLKRGRKVELALLITLFLALAALSLGGFLPLAFIMIMPMLWAAFRFRVVGAVCASVALAVIAAFLTATQISPFAESANYGRFGHYGLQLFLLVAASTALLVGAVTEENRAAFLKLRSSNATLGKKADERAALLAAIGEACPDLIFAKDRNLRLIYANRATLQIYGANSLKQLDEDSGERHYAIDADGDAMRRTDEAVLRSGQTQIAEENVILPDGTRRIYRSTKAPLFGVDGVLVGLAGVSIDVSDIKKSAAREQMLIREIQHRARNLLAVVQGIAQLTRADTVRGYKAALSQRIQALARSNDVLAASAWTGASLSRIVAEELAPYQEAKAKRARISGPEILLDPVTAQSLALVIHELATNAAKYGALSTPQGRIAVKWSIGPTTDGRTRLRLIWKEKGGPAVTPPTRQGFGSTLLAMFGEENPGDAVKFDWDVAGLTVVLTRILQDPERLSESISH